MSRFISSMPSTKWKCISPISYRWNYADSLQEPEIYPPTKAGSGSQGGRQSPTTSLPAPFPYTFTVLQNSLTDSRLSPHKQSGKYVVGGWYTGAWNATANWGKRRRGKKLSETFQLHGDKVHQKGEQKPYYNSLGPVNNYTIWRNIYASPPFVFEMTPSWRG